MKLHALGEEVRRSFVAGLFYRRERGPCGANYGLMSLNELLDHLTRARHSDGLFNRGEFGSLLIRLNEGELRVKVAGRVSVSC
jgi:hypothetical protein